MAGQASPRPRRAPGGLGLGLVVGYVLVAVERATWLVAAFTAPSGAVGAAASCRLPLAGWIPAWLSSRLQPQEVLREPD
jgi:hypothetical protein